MHRKGWMWICLVAGLGVPALVYRLSGTHLPPELAALVFGTGIVGAAFLLTWACEVLEIDISQGLALALVAFIAVLPEYAIDLYLAWQAGQDPHGSYIHYATANMTGANRLLIGIGWSVVVMLFWLRSRRTLKLRKSLSLELVFLLLATLFAFLIPLFHEIALWAAAVLILLFALYMWLQSRGKIEEPALVGPAATIGGLRKGRRRGVVVALCIYSAGIIVISASPFADGLIEVGKMLAIDEFILIQWVAPLASEAPEMLVAILLVRRGNPAGALALLISAKVNQWTLLVGTLPIAFSISLGESRSLPLDTRQTEEFFLTAAQSLFAVILLVKMRIGLVGALTLFLCFITQLLSPLLTLVHPVFTDDVILNIRRAYSLLYLSLAILLLVVDRERILELSRAALYVFNIAIRRTEPQR